MKKILSLLVAIAFLSSPLAHHADAHTTERIDPVFLQEVHHSSAWIDIVIELRDLPGVEFRHQQKAQPLSNSSASPASLLASTSAYQDHLLQKQDQFLAWVSKKKLSLIPRHRLTLTLNAITAEIKGTDIQTLSTSPLIYKIHDARHTFEPIRYLGSKSSRTELVMEDDKEGVLKMAIHTTGLSPAMVNELPFLLLDFSTLNRGEISFYPRSFVIHTASQNSYRVKAYEVKSRSSNRTFLLGDLNKDKVVDRKDFELFMTSFCSKAGEDNYDEKSDFNQDMRIDIFDLGILNREMGKSI